MENLWFSSVSKETSLHTLVTIEAHTVHFTLYILEQHHLHLLIQSLFCDSLGTLMDAKKIILWCCILLTRICKPRRFGVTNTKPYVSHQKGNHLQSLCRLHHTLYTSLFMIYTMPWNENKWIQLWVNGILGTLHSWKQYYTHIHTLLFTLYTHTHIYIYIYILHFIFQSICLILHSFL
jgi:hypothetical protein